MASTFTYAEIPAPLSEFKAGKPWVRRQFAEMTDAELLRFGVTAKFVCSRERRSASPWLETLQAQLDDARAEWKRRHPTLPLSISF